MPTETFFRLPEEKRRRLMEAARIEFSRRPLQEASIADIVKIAEIPRGSFYQYFEDKEDLYFYYYETLRKNHTLEMLRAVDEAQGDLFEAFEQYFSHLILEMFTGEESAFFRNVFLNMDYRASRRVVKDESGRPYAHDVTKELLEHLDRHKLRLASEEEVIRLIHLLMTTFFSAMGRGYHKRSKDPAYPVEEIVTDYKRILHWLKYGVYKKEGE